ncbi:MAG: leucyl/phenylalanyl-tRNA--protein transferase [Pseudobdellovibrionaceae bacterium]|jgi:leucyl/phenylalanyl-tRNA--protein transferase|nr:leucyl/phenylalanyl-tRNA--protein transferase [Pseudobdellovibrionaceae bacterium]
MAVPEFITPEDLLEIYALGLFPMAESATEKGFGIVEPKERALLPITDLHIPKRLKRKLLQKPYRVTIDTAFEHVIDQCAKARPETWINDDIQILFTSLHDRGIAHSVECWSGDELVGGLYGLALGGTFCGESMFSTRTDASKIALIYLCALLDHAGFHQLDAQFHNPHLEQFGIYQIPQADYVATMQAHLADVTAFDVQGKSIEEILAQYLEKRGLLV